MLILTLLFKFLKEEHGISLHHPYVSLEWRDYLVFVISAHQENGNTRKAGVVHLWLAHESITNLANGMVFFMVSVNPSGIEALVFLHDYVFTKSSGERRKRD